MEKVLALIISLVLAVPASSLFAADEGRFPEAIESGGKQLILNGVGTRKATFLKVRVYDAALYLTERSGDGEEILNSTEPKLFRMIFLRDVEAEKVRGGWDEGFAKNLENTAALQSEINAFKGWMPDLAEGDEITLEFGTESVSVTVEGERKGAIQGRAFSRALLSIWLGNPPNAELKEGLLGRAS